MIMNKGFYSLLVISKMPRKAFQMIQESAFFPIVISETPLLFHLLTRRFQQFLTCGQNHYPSLLPIHRLLLEKLPFPRHRHYS